MKETWPPIRWKMMVLPFWVVATLIFVVVFTLWPEVARSSEFRIASFLAVVGFSLLILRRRSP